jgi:hypothetical protein
MTLVRALAVAWRVVLVAVLLGGLSLAAVDPTLGPQYAPYAAVGGFLASRRPRNIIGWLLIGIGVAFIGTTAPPGLDVERLESGMGTTHDVIYAWAATWAGGASFLLYAALAMTFPSGRLPTGHWRSLALGGLAAGFVVALIPAFFPTLLFSPDGVTDVAVPNPVGFLPSPSADITPLVQVVVVALPIAILAASVVSLLIRYRRTTTQRGAGAIERLQIRWLLASVAFVVVSVIVGLVIFVLSDATVGWAWVPALIAYPTVPLAVGVAVTRYRLFEIDRIVSRTIAYALVTAILFAVFAGVNLALQASLGSILRGSAIGVAISTLVVAALFNPVRVRLQRAVDRRFNRARYDQEAALADFSAGLRDEMDVDRVLAAMRSVAELSVQPTSAVVWRRDGGSAP